MPRAIEDVRFEQRIREKAKKQKKPVDAYLIASGLGLSTIDTFNYIQSYVDKGWFKLEKHSSSMGKVVTER